MLGLGDGKIEGVVIGQYDGRDVICDGLALGLRDGEMED